MKPLAIFVRHSESTGNAENLVKGTSDYPLDEKGKRESDNLALRVARFKPSVVVTSPLQRASEPANRIAEHAGIPVKVDEGLLPQNFGDLEGEPRDTGEPVIRDYAMNHPGKKMPGGESFNDWDGRNTSAMRRVQMMIAQGERPLVVTHSRNLRELSHALFGEDPKDPTRGGPEPSGFVTLSRGQKLKIHNAPAAQGV